MPLESGHCHCVHFKAVEKTPKVTCSATHMPSDYEFAPNGKRQLTLTRYLQLSGCYVNKVFPLSMCKWICFEVGLILYGAK